FIPAAILGFIFNDMIDELLESVLVVSIMLVLGGILMLFVDKWFSRPEEGEQEITYKNAFIIGCYQCIAMIPGVSRSMATIVGGMSRGLSRKNAAEFSFFLAVPTMAAATGYKLLKLIMSDTGFELLKDNMGVLVIGNVVAFIVALLAIKFFIGFVTKYGFKLFGWYRIIVGGILLALLLSGHELTII
ncbi:undecaprenyl-diphosphate phosphatase, partial [Dysgonomonas gadei]|uniref:undecaprenyl-diphosphate phosphatase n=1 Tax=Dysgonomonas gadei TaxID=156974 RepID=UPI003AF18042